MKSCVGGSAHVEGGRRQEYKVSLYLVGFLLRGKPSQCPPSTRCRVICSRFFACHRSRTTMLRRALVSMVVAAPSALGNRAGLTASLSGCRRQRSVLAKKGNALGHGVGRSISSSGTARSASEAAPAGAAAADEPKNVRDAIIIGSGPAGYTAGRERR